MSTAIPVELRLYIINAIIYDVHPSSYIWPPSVRTALLHLSQTNRSWRAIATPILFRHIAINSLAQITALLELTDQLKHVESLALLPGPWHLSSNRIVGGTHAYCTLDLLPLFNILAPSLSRLFIMHLHRDEPACTVWPEMVSRLHSLRELVVDSYEGIFPHKVVPRRYAGGAGGRREDMARERNDLGREVLRPRDGAGHVEASGVAAIGPSLEGREIIVSASSSRPNTGSGISSVNDSASPPLTEDAGSDSDEDDADPHRAVPTWPFLPSLVRLATSGHSLSWRHYKFTDSFPLIEDLVFVDYGWIEDSPSQIRSMGRQLMENQSLQVVIVEQDRPYVRHDWHDDMRRLPADRFLFHLYDASAAQGAGPWLVRNALHGGIFDVGSAFSDLRASPEL